MSGFMLLFAPQETWGLSTEELRTQVEAMKAWDRLQAVYGVA